VEAPTARPGMGAILVDDGCVFRVWAPNASAVVVGGDFFHGGNATPIDWREGALPRDAGGGGGGAYWSGFVHGVVASSLYKFRIKNNGLGPGSGGVETWKHDPYARDAVSFGGNSVVVDRAFDWSGDAFQMPAWNELVIYELHIGTFNHEHGRAPGTFEEAIGKLDYLPRLAVKSIGGMPACTL